MKYSVLGLGYTPSEYEAERTEWMKHGIIFDFAEDLEDAAEKLRSRNYVCTVMKADQLSHQMLSALQRIKPTPAIVLPSTCSVAEARLFADFSVIPYARAMGQKDFTLLDGKERREALTIVKVKDITFCLEHRSVEIRGKEIELTEKEFDIFALLISNPKRVFTYEMIMNAVWQEDHSFYSRKVITTHVSNLRRKLKTTPDIPEYIRSVRGVGYKFDVPQ